MFEFAGEFETHITVEINDSRCIAALKQWSRMHQLTCLHIVLDRGCTISQPMLTQRGKGRLPDRLAAASDLKQNLEKEGFPVSRIKIEAAPWNQDIPQSDQDALRHPSSMYFEHHIKLLLAPDAESPALGRLAQQHRAHLSRNALRARLDGLQERFITQRCIGVGYSTARQRLDALLKEIAPLDYPVLEIEQEYVVHDSNIGIDSGWIKNEE